jgi:hypothetical protein
LYPPAREHRERAAGSERHPAALAGDTQLADRIRFVVELDRLKQVLRRTVVTADQVRAVNAAIEDGSPALGRLAQRLIDDPVTRGSLPETGR